MHNFEHVKPRHCNCCGDKIVTNTNQALPNLCILHFELSNGAVTPQSFCADCAKEEWTDERLLALKKQIDDAYVLSVEGKMYQQVGDTWIVTRTNAPALPPEQAQKELDWMRSLRILGVSRDIPPITAMPYEPVVLLG